MDNSHSESKDLILGFFMTRGISFEHWDSAGCLDREILVLREFAKHFKKILIFSYGGPEEKEYQDKLPGNAEIVFHNTKISSHLAAMQMATRFSDKIQECNVLRSNQMDGSWAVSAAGRKYNKPVILRSGYDVLKNWKLAGVSPIKRFVLRGFLRYAYRRADAVTTTTQIDLDRIVNRWGLRDIFTATFPNGIDTALFRPINTIHKDKAGVICIGSLKLAKNQSLLIRALSGTHIPATIVGKGPEEEKLKALARDFDVNAKFISSVKNSSLPELINQHRIFILPSLYEGNPKALMEAMACGSPVIGTDVEGINCIIENDKNGLLVDFKPEVLKAGILKLINNEDICDRMGIAGRNLILENFALNKVVTNEASFVGDVLQKFSKR